MESQPDKIVFVGDVHLRATPPRYRKSDYFSETIDMLSWIVAKAEEVEAKAIIFGGDLGHRPEWSGRMLVETSRVLSGKIPVYVVPGNHDVLGYDYEDWQSTGIGLLSLICDNFKVLPGTWKVIGSTFSITTFPAGFTPTDALLAGEFENKRRPGNLVEVAVIHAPVGPYSTPWMKSYKEVPGTGFDFCLFSDIHEEFGPWKAESGCTMLNCGCLNRMTIGDIGKVPKIAIIGSDKSVEVLEVPHVSDEVAFDMDSLNRLDIEKCKAIKAGVAVSQAMKSIDIKSYIKEIAEKSGYSDIAVNTLIRELPNG